MGEAGAILHLADHRRRVYHCRLDTFLWRWPFDVYLVKLKSEGGSPNQPPLVSFTFTPAILAVGEEVTCDASASTDRDGQISPTSGTSKTAVREAVSM